MKKSAKKALAIFFSLLGSALGLYIGGYWLFARPVYWLVTGFTGGTLTAGILIINIFKIFIASTIGGGIWCVCDIIAGLFRDDPRED
jgi:hypothetical protein